MKLMILEKIRVIRTCSSSPHAASVCHAIPVCILWGSRSIPVCIRGYQRFPYANRDCMTHNPRMHMAGIKINPRVHTGITEIPVCIRGSHDTNNPHMHKGICTIPVCIQGYFSNWLYAYRKYLIFPYWKSSLVSPYAYFCIQGSPYAYGDPHM
jgi:hypothetical protein